MTLWPVTHQAPPSLGFSREEYWSGLPFPPPGHLSDLGIESSRLMVAVFSRKIGKSKVSEMSYSPCTEAGLEVEIDA